MHPRPEPNLPECSHRCRSWIHDRCPHALDGYFGQRCELGGGHWRCRHNQCFPLLHSCCRVWMCSGPVLPQLRTSLAKSTRLCPNQMLVPRRPARLDEGEKSSDFSSSIARICHGVCYRILLCHALVTTSIRYDAAWVLHWCLRSICLP